MTLVKKNIGIDVEKIVEYLLDQQWHNNCLIDSHYIPKGCRGKEDEDEHAYVAVIYDNGTEYKPKLRYSKGPKQGFFWDIYGDDMNSVELAIIALANAPAPVNVGPITVSLPIKNKIKEDE